MLERLLIVMEKIFDVELVSDGSTALADIVPEAIEGWDSMGHLNLAMAIQDEFSVELTDDDIENMLDGAEEIVRILKKHGVN